MRIEECLILCPTYKEAFTLRRALIELGVDWCFKSADCSVRDIKDWKETWEKYGESTIYHINNYYNLWNIVTIGSHKYFTTQYKINYCEGKQKNYKVYTVKEFASKYINKSIKGEHTRLLSDLIKNL